MESDVVFRNASSLGLLLSVGWVQAQRRNENSDRNVCLLFMESHFCFAIFSIPSIFSCVAEVVEKARRKHQNWRSVASVNVQKHFRIVLKQSVLLCF